MAMIKIFDATDRNFSTAGNIVIEPTKCIEYKKKSLNGWYIEVEMPIKYKEYIEKDKLCVIKTKSKLNPQAFRIEEDIKYTNRKISFTAVHVMFDADRYFLLDVRPTNLNGLNALNYINSRTDNISPFVVYSNVENLNTAYFIRKTLLEAWIVIEERWGGVFDADNWNISFMQSVGHDNGETIIYGKNMQSMEIYEDWSNVVTKLYPVGYDGIMLPEKYITSDVQYDIPYTKKIEFQTELEDDEKTEENLIRELRINANAYIEENKYPKVSYTTASNINNNMEIGDTIQVLHPLVSIQTEVMEYEYNNISDRVISMTFGNYSRDVKRKFNNIKNTIKQLNQEISKQEIAISNQTNLINSLNKSGYIYIDDNEILILDTLPKENAHNVWRWNMGGLGFSSNGYEGPFETAITIDGSINANFITTGTIAVSRIEGLANIIESVVSNVTEQNNKISTLTQTVDELSSKISDVADVTVHGESDYAVVSLEDINESEPIMVKVHTVGENISYTYPSNILYPSDTTYLKNRILRFINTNTNVSTDYELPDDLLYYNSEIYDEFYLDYESHTCEVTKRCGYNEDGTVYALAEEVVTSYTYPTIELQDGNYTVRLLGYETAYLFVRLMASNIYTTQFATKVEVNSAITQTTQNINLSVNQKLTNYSTTNEMNTAINLAKDLITSSVSQTYITKTDSANNIDTAKNAAINSANSTTDTKLQNYYTKAQTESKITQKADEITTSVSATYLTKSNASNTYLTKNNANTTYLNKQDAIDIYLSKTSASNIYLTQNNAGNTYATKASLTLKVDKASLISEINASADVMRLSSGRLIIDSGNFQLDANGHIICTSGDIGGFNIGTNSFNTNVSLGYTYTQGDYVRASQIVVNRITPTSEDYKKYDFNQNGVIDYNDLIWLDEILNGVVSTEGYFKLNTLDAKKCIQLTDNRGKTLVSLGAFGCYLKRLDLEYLRVNNTTRIGGSTSVGGELSVTRGIEGESTLHIKGFSNIEDNLRVDRDITCQSVVQFSKEENKKNFEKLDNDIALEIVLNTDIYKYNMKSEKDTAKKHIGFVIGKDYRYSSEITAEQEGEEIGVDNYSMTSATYGAIQRLYSILSEVQEKIKKMEA